MAFNLLPRSIMIGVESLRTESMFRLESRVFGKLLHLARFQGWRPEKVSYEWPSETWETEIILPHLGPYMVGDVSDTDARGLATALQQIHDNEAAALDTEEYGALLTLLALLQDGPVRTALVSSHAPTKANL